MTKTNYSPVRWDEEASAILKFVVSGQGEKWQQIDADDFETILNETHEDYLQKFSTFIDKKLDQNPVVTNYYYESTRKPKGYALLDIYSILDEATADDEEEYYVMATITIKGNKKHYLKKAA